MFDFIYLWADVIWLPTAFLIVHKPHRWLALGFVICSMILMRLQAEMMIFVGYDNGIMGIMSSNVYSRGLVVSSIFYILFFIMAHYSKETKKVIFMAASLTIFFAIFVTNALVMLL